MSFRLVDAGWDEELKSALLADHSAVRIVCPFIKRRTAERLLAHGTPATLQVLTRFNLDDFSAGVSDLAALRLLLEHGATIRGVRRLHAKLYLLGASRAILTSANLTEAAMLRNHELGFVAEEPGIVGPCRKYFDDLWSRAGGDLTLPRLQAWESKIEAHQASGARPTTAPLLGDDGAEAGLPAAAPAALPAWADEVAQGFVKFFGEGHRRELRETKVFDEVKQSLCHRICAYPRRPRQVRDGALMFMGRLVKQRDDVVIYGVARALSHQPGRDEASNKAVKLPPSKKSWPYFVRVHGAQFVGGTLANGVSLNDMMDEHRENLFASTQRNKRTGKGNIEPQLSLRQQPAVELTAEGIVWLAEALERVFIHHGKLSPAELQSLDWTVLT